jgi:hypothetical protein
MNGERMLRLFQTVLIATLLFASLGLAQTDQGAAATPPAQQQAQLTVGPTAFVGIQGRSTSLGVISSLDVNLGYQFTPHVSADIGLPIFYVRSPYALVTTHDWETNTLLGDPYLDARYTRTFSGVDFMSVVTLAVPAKTPARVFTTGRFGVDWFNHLSSAKPLKGITPFINFGAASKTVDRYIMPRPYSLSRPYESQGFMGDVEGGLSYRIRRFYNVGASMYAMLPGGRQKVFSKIITPGSSVVGDGNYNRVWDKAFETIGSSDIARDNGYSAWVEVTRFKNVNMQFGVTHSVRYRFDSATIAFTFDATTGLRELTGTTGR